MSEPQSNPTSGDGEEVITGDGAALDADLDKLQQERDIHFQQLARVQADFKNAQRRLEAEKSQAIQYANAKLIQSLIPAIDNFDRALEIDPAKTDAATVLKGMRIVHDHILKILGEADVEMIAPKPGTPFDPNQHQALVQQKDERYAEPTVVQLYQNGYSFNGRVLRPAQVVVGKKD